SNRQIPSALELSANPCATLVDQNENEKGLEGDGSDRDQDRRLVFLPHARPAKAQLTRGRQTTLRNSPALQFSFIKQGGTGSLRWDFDAGRRCTPQEPKRDIRRLDCQLIVADHRSA